MNMVMMMMILVVIGSKKRTDECEANCAQNVSLEQISDPGSRGRIYGGSKDKYYPMIIDTGIGLKEVLGYLGGVSSLQKRGGK